MPIIKSFLAVTLLSLIYLSTALAAEEKKCVVDEDPICFFERAETNFYKADSDRVLITNDYKTFINRYKNNIIIDEKKLAIAYQHLADINWQRTHYKFNYFPDNTYESALKIIDYYNKAESYGHESASGQLCNIYDDLFGYPFNPDNIEQKKI